MEQVIYNDNLVMLQQKLIGYPKTYEDLKIIASIIRGTQIFDKLNELYHQKLSNEGQIKLCNNVEIKIYSKNQLISPDPIFGVQLLLKGQVDVFLLEEGYIYKKEKQITSLIPLSYIEQELEFDKQIFCSSQLKYQISVDDSLVLSINKQECDDIYQFYGEIFLFKHKTLCKIIPGLGDLNSKRILAALATQFESLTLPHLTTITEENKIDDYLYFLAQGDIEMFKNEENIFNIENNGIIGDELIIDPDQDQNQQICYEFTAKVKSSQVLLYRIRVKIFNRLFPNSIIRQIIQLHKQKQLMRLLMGSKPFDQQQLCTSPNNNELKKSKATLILAKDSIKSYDKVDIQFQQYQVPKHSRVLKYNKNVLDQFGEEEKKSKKITINEFVQQTKQSKEPQIKILEKVENPYSFASNVNSEGFLKQYYSNLIRVGLVKPPNRIAPQNHEAIQRSRINSAVKLVEKTHKQLKTRRSTSLIYGKNDPILQINTFNQNKDNNVNVNSQKKLDKTRTITSFFATPRTSQQLYQIHNPSSGYFQFIETSKCETPQSRSTIAKSSHVFRPYSGFMDHSSRLSQQSEMQKRLRKPNQHFF